MTRPEYPIPLLGSMPSHVSSLCILYLVAMLVSCSDGVSPTLFATDGDAVEDIVVAPTGLALLGDYTHNADSVSMRVALSLPAWASVRLIELTPGEQEAEDATFFTLEVTAYTSAVVHFWLTAERSDLFGV